MVVWNKPWNTQTSVHQERIIKKLVYRWKSIYLEEINKQKRNFLIGIVQTDGK